MNFYINMIYDLYYDIVFIKFQFIFHKYEIMIYELYNDIIFGLIYLHYGNITLGTYNN